MIYRLRTFGIEFGQNRLNRLVIENFLKIVQLKLISSYRGEISCADTLILNGGLGNK